MVYQASKKKMISMFLIFSLFITFFSFPTPARAGMLGSLLCKIRPFAHTLGKIGGAVVGASFCGAFLPPLGLLAGAIGGWIAGGIITNYATGSLTHLATLAGAACGAMALASFGPIGYVAGVLAGGYLARKVMGLVYRADQATTGGMIFSRMAPARAGSRASAPVMSTSSAPVTYSKLPTAPVTAIVNNTKIATHSIKDKIKAAAKKYKDAYKRYIAATKLNNASKISKANKLYGAAYREYKKLTGKEPSK